MPQRSPVTKTPKRSLVEKIPQRSPVQKPQASPIDETTWTEAIGGLRPDRLIRSFAKGSWETVKGIPGLPAIGYGLAKELYGYSKSKPKISMGVSVGTTKAGDKLPDTPELLAEQYPILSMIYQDYEDRFGSMEGFKKALADDPFSILSEMLPILAKAGKAGKLGKYAEYAEMADPTNLPGYAIKGAAGGIRKGIKKGSGFYRKGYDPKVESKYGEGPNKEALTTSRSATELSEEYGAGVKSDPAMVLSDSRRVREREGIQLRYGGDVETKARDRFDKAEEAVETSGTRIIGQTSVSDGLNPEIAGQNVIKNLNEWQDGKKGDFKQKFGDLENRTYKPDPNDPLSVDAYSIDTEVPETPIGALRQNKLGEVVGDDFISTSLGSFENTLEILNEMKKSDSNLLSNADYDKVINIFKGVITKADEGGFTIRDMDKLRTNFRTELDLAVSRNEVSEIGSGTIATKVYSALTNDFYNALEKTVDAYPDRFPDNFVDSVKAAKLDYQQTMVLLDTTAAKYLFSNQRNPTRIVEHVLTTMTQKDVADLKVIIGDNGWNELRPALIARIFDRGKRNGEWSPGGLKRALAGINTRSKNRVRDLFGDDTAQQLAELAEYSKRLERKKISASDAMNDIMMTRKFADILSRIGGLTLAGSSAFIDMRVAAAGVATAGIQWFGRNRMDKFLNSDEGREWMLQGREIPIPIGDRVIKLVPQDIRRAMAYGTRTTERAEERQKKKQRTKFGLGRGSFGGRTFPLE